MYVRDLLSEDFEEVAKLEEEIYPESMCNGYEDFINDFNNATINNRFCYVAFTNKKLVGYIIAYRIDGKSQFFDRDNHIYISDLACKDCRALLPLLLYFNSNVQGYKVVAELRETSYKMLEHINKKYNLFENNPYKLEFLENYYGDEHAWKVELTMPYKNRDNSQNDIIMILQEIYKRKIKFSSIINRLYYTLGYDKLLKYKGFILRSLYSYYLDYFLSIEDDFKYIVRNEVSSHGNTDNSIKYREAFIKNNPEYVECKDLEHAREYSEAFSSIKDADKYDKVYSYIDKRFAWYKVKDIKNFKSNPKFEVVKNLAYFRRIFNKVILGYEKKNNKNVKTIYIIYKNKYIFSNVVNVKKTNIVVPYINSLTFDREVNKLKTIENLKERFIKEFGKDYMYESFLQTLMSIKRILKANDFEDLLESLIKRIKYRGDSNLITPQQQQYYDNANVAEQNRPSSYGLAAHDYTYAIGETLTFKRYLTAKALLILIDKEYDDLVSIKNILSALLDSSIRRMNTKNLRKEISTAIKNKQSLKVTVDSIVAKANENFLRRNKISKVILEKASPFLERMNVYAKNANFSRLCDYFKTNTKDIIYGTYEGLFKEYNLNYRSLEIAELVQKCLGNKGIGAIINNPKRLYRALSRIQDVKEIVSGNIVKENIPLILSELNQRKVQFPKEYNTLGELLGKIEPKCSPEFLVAGDASVCCMSFGQEKAIDYALEKGFGIFNVYYKGRIIANSVIWVNELYNCLVIDNIEVAPNYINFNLYIKNLYLDMIKYVLKEYKLDFAVQGETYNDLKLYHEEYKDVTNGEYGGNLNVSDGYVRGFRIKAKDVKKEYFYTDANRGCYIIEIKDIDMQNIQDKILEVNAKEYEKEQLEKVDVHDVQQEVAYAVQQLPQANNYF